MTEILSIEAKRAARSEAAKKAAATRRANRAAALAEMGVPDGIANAVALNEAAKEERLGAIAGVGADGNVVVLAQIEHSEAPAYEGPRECASCDSPVIGSLLCGPCSKRAETEPSDGDRWSEEMAAEVIAQAAEGHTSDGTCCSTEEELTAAAEVVAAMEAPVHMVGESESRPEDAALIALVLKLTAKPAPLARGAKTGRLCMKQAAKGAYVTHDGRFAMTQHAGGWTVWSAKVFDGSADLGSIGQATSYYPALEVIEAHYR